MAPDQYSLANVARSFVVGRPNGRLLLAMGRHG
jgi:hypothetical protein